MASSMAALIAPMVLLSDFGMMRDMEYLGSEPLILCGSKMCTKEARHLPVITLVAIFIFLSPHTGARRYSAKSEAAVEMACRGSDTGTSVDVPSGLYTNLPSTSRKAFLPMRFSRSPTPSSVVL